MERVNICISQHLVDALMFHSGFTDSLGLLNGKMGEAITFYRLSPMTKNTIYTDFAGELIDVLYYRYQTKGSKVVIDFLDQWHSSPEVSREKPDDQVVLPVDFNPQNNVG